MNKTMLKYLEGSPSYKREINEDAGSGGFFVSVDTDVFSNFSNLQKIMKDYFSMIPDVIDVYNRFHNQVLSSKIILKIDKETVYPKIRLYLGIPITDKDFLKDKDNLDDVIKYFNKQLGTGSKTPKALGFSPVFVKDNTVNIYFDLYWHKV